MCQKEQKEMWIEEPCCNYKAIAELKSFIKQRFCSFNNFQLILYVCMLLLPYVLWWWIKLQKPIYNTFSGGTWSTKTLVLGYYYQICEKKNNNVKNDWIKEMTIKKMNKNVFHLVLNSSKMCANIIRARCGCSVSSIRGESENNHLFCFRGPERLSWFMAQEPVRERRRSPTFKTK